jgi:hypothetical protein
MRLPLMRLLAVAAVLAAGGVILGAAPAYASGQIFAVVTLTNNTNTLIQIPFSGASTPGAWGTQGNTLQGFSGYEVMPDGTPPRILAPGQTMLWGTKSDGGFLSTSGTGGSLSIPLPEDQEAAMQWSVPWSYFNGGFPPQNPNGSASVSDGSGFPPAQPFTISGGALACGPDGNNTCLFAFVLAGGPSAAAATVGELVGGQSISMPASCPSGVTCNSATHSLTSPDGSTTLAIQAGQCCFGSCWGCQGAWGGVLDLVDGSSTWSAGIDDIVAAQMGTDGNFVAYDANGDIVWQSDTSGHPGAFLSVTASEVSVMVPDGTVCLPRLGCVPVDETLWSASATTPVTQ